MKKFLLVFCLTVLLILSGCTHKAYPTDYDVDQSEIYGETDHPETVEITCGLVKGITLKTYQEYLDFLTESEPQYECIRNMIKYDSISRIGEFKCFITYSFLSTKTDGLAVYNYVLGDQSGEDLFFTVSDWSKRSFKRPVTAKLGDDLKASDMRTIEDERNGYYLVEGLIQYRYIEGDLISIVWDYNGLTFTITSGSLKKELNDYPYEYDTFTSRLLDANTAGEAIKSLMKDIFEY